MTDSTTPAAPVERGEADDVDDGCQFHVDLDADEHWMAETDELLLTRDADEARRWLAIGHDVRRVRVQISDAARPGEPDKVREALVRVFNAFPPEPKLLLATMGLIDTLGIKRDGDSAELLADALLALRAAPSGEAEPEAWVAIDPADGGHLAYGTTELDAQRRANVNGAFVVKPLYTHPAAPQDGPQVTEAAKRVVALWDAAPSEDGEDDIFLVEFEVDFKTAMDALRAALTPQPKEGR